MTHILIHPKKISIHGEFYNELSHNILIQIGHRSSYIEVDAVIFSIQVEKL